MESAARLVSSLDYFLRYGEHYIEGYSWIKTVLGRQDAVSNKHRLKLLTVGSLLAWFNDDLLQSNFLSREALLLAQEMNDRSGQAWALIEFGISSINQPELHEEATMRAEAGLAIFRDLEDEAGLAQALNILGELARAAGEYDRAQEFYEECMTVSRKSGEIIRQVMMQVNLAHVANHLGESDRARGLALEVIRQWVDIGRKQGVSDGLAILAGSLGKLGEPEKAARLLGASAAILTEMGIDYLPSDQNESAEYLAEVRALLDEAAFEAAWAEGQAMTLDEAVAYALAP
jgi:tetratricopeptide (TPR) repeat protein